MGKGFNNYMCKKFFHPASRDNLKRVWMAEQQADAYKKKQEELRTQYEKEQNLHENKAMLSKESKDKLSVNFMYEPPPGVRKEREKDTTEPEYKFEWQRQFNAPRESYCKGDTEIRDQPFGIQVRNVRCIKCHKWGHINTDKECSMYSISMSEARKLHSEAEASDMMAKNVLEEQMKEDGLMMKRSAMELQNIKQINQQHKLVASDAEDEQADSSMCGGGQEGGNTEMAFLKSLSKEQKLELLRKLEKIEKLKQRKEKKAKKDKHKIKKEKKHKKRSKRTKKSRKSSDTSDSDVESEGERNSKKKQRKAALKRAKKNGKSSKHLTTNNAAAASSDEAISVESTDSSDSSSDSEKTHARRHRSASKTRENGRKLNGNEWHTRSSNGDRKAGAVRLEKGDRSRDKANRDSNERIDRRKRSRSRERNSNTMEKREGSRSKNKDIRHSPSRIDSRRRSRSRNEGKRGSSERMEKRARSRSKDRDRRHSPARADRSRYSRSRDEGKTHNSSEKIEQSRRSPSNDSRQRHSPPRRRRSRSRDSHRRNSRARNERRQARSRSRDTEHKRRNRSTSNE